MCIVSPRYTRNTILTHECSCDVNYDMKQVIGLDIQMKTIELYFVTVDHIQKFRLGKSPKYIVKEEKYALLHMLKGSSLI